MGCITAKARRIGGINAASYRIGGINARASCVSGIRASCSLICTINTNQYLRVTPIEPQWIEVGEDVTYNIRSNVNWNIV